MGRRPCPLIKSRIDISSYFVVLFCGVAFEIDPLPVFDFLRSICFPSRQPQENVSKSLSEATVNAPNVIYVKRPRRCASSEYITPVGLNGIVINFEMHEGRVFFTCVRDKVGFSFFRAQVDLARIREVIRRVACITNDVWCA